MAERKKEASGNDNTDSESRKSKAQGSSISAFRNDKHAGNFVLGWPTIPPEPSPANENVNPGQSNFIFGQEKPCGKQVSLYVA